ncbi:hypothetical protein EKH55_4750 [Sinorhizobium alkalisoli]|nr:hypothetical protein EKH55_4750 [Sinorhizobium alkalisoli]
MGRLDMSALTVTSQAKVAAATASLGKGARFSICHQGASATRRL